MAQKATRRKRQDMRPQAVDMAVYGDQWVAWSYDGLRILTSGATLEECEANVERLGYTRGQVIFNKIPPARHMPPGPA